MEMSFPLLSIIFSYFWALCSAICPLDALAVLQVFEHMDTSSDCCLGEVSTANLVFFMVILYFDLSSVVTVGHPSKSHSSVI